MRDDPSGFNPLDPSRVNGKRKWRDTGGMNEPLPCLRRTEPSAALIPRLGQSKLVYVPAATTDIRWRIYEATQRQTSPSGARPA